MSDHFRCEVEYLVDCRFGELGHSCHLAQQKFLPLARCVKKQLLGKSFRDLGLELQIVCWYEVSGASLLITNYGAKREDIGDHPVSILFLEHVADELAYASVD
jgi:hypothetical protein